MGKITLRWLISYHQAIESPDFNTENIQDSTRRDADTRRELTPEEDLSRLGQGCRIQPQAPVQRHQCSVQ